ncbi:MAG: L-aspartate oxidase [Pseudomonadota bacterium]
MSPSHTITIPNIIIIGAGLAGLYTALRLAPTPVTVITPAPLGEGASSTWAQGGIAAAVHPGDSAAAHAADTIKAGAGLVDDTVAKLTAVEAAEQIHNLLAYGVPFDRDLEDRLICSREAAHSTNRVVRVKGDGAGRAIMQAIMESVRHTPSIRLLEGYTAIDLICEARHVTGVILERSDDPAAHYKVEASGAIVLATGGIGALYARSTNPSYARGSALALAARAGASIADAEFVQFHPTAIDVAADPTPLATEALRGEGARLINRRGHHFMLDYHAAGDLGPRDIVARAVFQEIQEGRGAFLDCRSAIGNAFPERFPAATNQCRAHGIDPVTQLIPVIPAAHYHMGGVATDIDGHTSAKGLWAIGECASTGLHGANRLASNSLLEAVVFGARAAARITVEVQPAETRLVRILTSHLPDDGARHAAIAMIRTTLAENAGVIRNVDGLKTALDTLLRIEQAADGDLIIANAAIAARFIAEAALRRKESRGAHFRDDFPKSDQEQCKRRTITLKGLNIRYTIAAGAELPFNIQEGTP